MRLQKMTIFLISIFLLFFLNKKVKKFHQLHENFLIGEDSLMKKVLEVPVLIIDTMDSKEKMFERIDQHSTFIMNNLIKRESLKEITCLSN